MFSDLVSCMVSISEYQKSRLLAGLLNYCSDWKKRKHLAILLVHDPTHPLHRVKGRRH